MQVLRRGDQDGIDVLVFEQPPVVEVRLGAGSDVADLLQPARVDVGDADAFGVGAGQRLAQNLRAAVAGADDAQADAGRWRPARLAVARVPASPVATLPIKMRRDCIGTDCSFIKPRTIISNEFCLCPREAVAGKPAGGS